MTAAALKLKLNLITLDLTKKEHLNPDFMKINPQHSIPTLVDNDFAIWESRAICIYLVDKYAKNDSLYPKDPKTRALINQRLYFDMGMLYKAFSEYYFAPFHGSAQTPENLKKFEDTMKLLDKYLENHEYAAATRNMSVADLCLFATVSTFEVVNVDFSPYPWVEKWFNLMKETAPGRELNKGGVDAMRAFFKDIQEKNQK